MNPALFFSGPGPTPKHPDPGLMRVGSPGVGIYYKRNNYYNSSFDVNFNFGMS